MFDPRLERLHKLSSGYWPTRIFSQLEYAHELSLLAGGAYDAAINKTIQLLDQQFNSQGALAKDVVLQAEAELTTAVPDPKRFRVLCVAHAHIDMNWMWRWDETVAISLDTFRTMLDLMAEYPQFKFSQSQASVYRIVEEHDPEMLKEIKARVKEGRWEVTATTWVEADKNMPSSESQARHLLYARRYLSRLLDLNPDTLRLDFEPDTFGHHRNVPEILASGGVRYYYHCRGDQGDLLYHWISPSGKSILVYREPLWYLGAVEPNLAAYVPGFCQKHGVKTFLRVYGVGDHGGGPTRRDLERIQDMDTWPVFPAFCFGTFTEFFAEVEGIASSLPVVDNELNFIFTGCYTSQSRIKRANRMGEAALGEAETFNAFAALAQGSHYPGESFATAWQNVLFNQFHDIIPGSGVIDTREYSLGLFQQTMAAAGSQKSRAFRALTRQAISPRTEQVANTISEGAGVGFGVEEFKLSQVSRGHGRQRLFHIFNPAPYERGEVVELVIWDWEGDLQRLVIRDERGQLVPHQIMDQGWNDYWGHRYLRLLAQVTTPPCGYRTYTLDQTEDTLETKAFPRDPRVEVPDDMVLENEHIRAEFDQLSCSLISLQDKNSGEEMVDPIRTGTFRIILEDDQKGMTAWTVGRYMRITDLAENVRLIRMERGPLRQSLTYEVAFGASRLKVTVSLDDGSSRLDFDVDCDWHEIGRAGEGVPQLNFLLPMAFNCSGYRYDIPFGSIDRPGLEQDVPASSWGLALPRNPQQSTLLLTTTGSYGFRGVEDSLALTLIRSSYDPDPYPELGIHKLRFSVAVVDCQAPNSTYSAQSFNILHPLNVFSGSEGSAEAHSYFSLESHSVVVTGIKLAEDRRVDNELIVRLYESEGNQTRVGLRFFKPVKEAVLVDLNEKPIPDAAPVTVDRNQVSFTIAAHQIATIWVKF